MEILGLIDLPTWSLLCVAVALYLYYVWPEHKLKKLGYPGPPCHPIIGGIISSASDNKGIVEFDTWVYKTYGKVAGVESIRNELTNIFVADFDMMREILLKNSQNFIDRSNVEVLNPKPLDKGLLAARGDTWRRIRATLSPTFSTGKLKNMQDLMLKAVNSLMKNLQEKEENKETFDARIILSSYTLDVIGRTGFGLDLDLDSEKNEFLKYAQQIDDWEFSSPLLLLAIYLPSLFGGYYLRKHPLKDSLAFFCQVVKQATEHRQQNPGDYRDFIQLMIDAHKMEPQEGEAEEEEQTQFKKKALTEDEQLANALLFLLAGFSTTALTMTFLLYELATNPEAQKKCIEEIDEVMQEEDPNYTNISKLQYLSQCIDETLRIYPPGFRLDRVGKEDTVIKGWKIPAGVTVAIPVYAIHHDPEFYPDPEKFDPDRFTPEAKAARNPLQYLPFGMGPRNCIGMRLALMEIKMAVAKILQKFWVKTCKETQIPLRLAKFKLMRPDHGVFLQVESRK